jgi:serine/threonine protein phosphatase PrpC
MRLRVGASTDTGRVRTLNEDVYVLRADQGLFMVCDGMGGAPAGDVASQMAADIIVDRLNPRRADCLETPDHPQSYLPRTNSLAEAVRCSNQVIYESGQRDPRLAEMGTTVVSAWLAHHIASVAHVGDSRAYLWHHNQLELLTSDHSLVEAEVHAGTLDQDEGQQACGHNVLLRVVGGAPDVDVDLNEVPIQAGDYLLLCSDGLTRMVSDATLAEAISRFRDPQRICDFLIDTANRNGGTDNITVVVVEVVESWWRRMATRWSR